MACPSGSPQTARGSAKSTRGTTALAHSATGVGATGSAPVTVDGEPIPGWLTTKSITKRRYLTSSTGNVHGLQSADYETVRWPLPSMFGAEKYAFSLVDIEDERYAAECAAMGETLNSLFYDLQIVDLEWRACYSRLVSCEHAKKTLPDVANQRARDRMESDVQTQKKRLLELQQQKDSLEAAVNAIFERCAEIKRIISKEELLEEIREDMSQQVEQRYPAGDAFWSQKFNVQSGLKEQSGGPFPGRDWVHSMDLDQH